MFISCHFPMYMYLHMGHVIEISKTYTKLHEKVPIIMAGYSLLHTLLTYSCYFILTIANLNYLFIPIDRFHIMF